MLIKSYPPPLGWRVVGCPPLIGGRHHHSSLDPIERILPW
nr:MAG TPA: hypothetical protein [Caudoviricetes sp.]